MMFARRNHTHARRQAGYVHYVMDVGIEENLPEFLCGLVTDNIWTAREYSQETCCPECLTAARAQSLKQDSGQSISAPSREPSR